MKSFLLEYIRCPVTNNSLEFHRIDEAQGDDVISGQLRSVSDDVEYLYSIDQGVPNLLGPIVANKPKQTIDVFGNEWKHYNYWGWLERIPEGMTKLDVVGGMMADAERMFRHKTQIESIQVEPGAVALDVGCGNGRHSFQALKAGYANVISLDASNAVYVARSNFSKRGIDGAHFVRGNALALPIADDCVDHSFSIGVMQHTGQPEAFLREQSRVTKAAAPISVNCYGTGTLLYEGVDHFLRSVTTRMPIDYQRVIADKLAAFGKWVWSGPDKGVRKFIRENMNIQTTDHHMFDWYSPKIADHYSPKFLLRLFEKLSLQPVSGNYEIWRPDYQDADRRRNHYAFCFHLRNAK